MDGVFIIHQDGRTLIHLYMDACQLGCGAITTNIVYHAMLSTSVLIKTNEMSPSDLKCSHSIDNLGPPVFTLARASVL